MSRKPEPLLDRVARHVNLPVDQLTPDNRDHWVWTGAFSLKETKVYRHRKWANQQTRRPQPILKGIGNPVRALFAHFLGEPLDPLTHVKNTCGVAGCVNPACHVLVPRFSVYHNRSGKIPDAYTSRFDTPTRFDERDEAQIESILEAIGTDDLDFTLQFYQHRPDLIEEAYRRAK